MVGCGSPFFHISEAMGSDTEGFAGQVDLRNQPEGKDRESGKTLESYDYV